MDIGLEERYPDDSRDAVFCDGPSAFCLSTLRPALTSNGGERGRGRNTRRDGKGGAGSKTL